MKDSILDQLLDTYRKKGRIKIMFTGDSTMYGTSYDQGFRVAISILLAQYGMSPTFVGDITPVENKAQWFWDSFGGAGTVHALGGTTTKNLIDGATGSDGTLRAWATVMTDQDIKPDLIVSCHGTNDSSSTDLETFKQFYRLAKGIPFIHILPFDSNSTTASFSTLDTSRKTVRDNFRTARGTEFPDVLFCDATQALGMYTRVNTRDLTNASGNFNAVFQDGTHLTMEGAAIIGAHVFSLMSGVSMRECIQTLAACMPLNPLPWVYGDELASGTSNQILVDTGPRVVTLNHLSITHTGSTGEATVTLDRFRERGDGTTPSVIESWEWVLEVGQTVGFSLPTGSCYEANYNEGFQVDVAGDSCDVRASGFKHFARSWSY